MAGCKSVEESGLWSAALPNIVMINNYAGLSGAELVEKLRKNRKRLAGACYAGPVGLCFISPGAKPGALALKEGVLTFISVGWGLRAVAVVGGQEPEFQIAMSLGAWFGFPVKEFSEKKEALEWLKTL